MPRQSKNPTADSRGELIITYDAIHRHWVHAEEERWSILNNFLVASTILLLAWAAVFVAQATTARNIVLTLLSLGGFGISLLWITIASRVSIFIDLYTRLGEEVEASLVLANGPFIQARERIRHGKKLETRLTGWPNRVIDSLGLKISSRVFVTLIPGVFAVVYIALLLSSVFT